MSSEKICALISVYHPYRWIAPVTWQLVQRFWPAHPPVFFCGLTTAEAGDLPHIPCGQAELPRNWASFVYEACLQLRERGFTKCYFMLEDHPPLAKCHEEHLSVTLPSLLDALDASYIGLMGWDNRRFITRSPISKDGLRLAHLTASQAPRFHLHPSLFRLDALIGCLEFLLTQKNQTPWGFEKNNDKPDAPLPEAWKNGCYQICGEELRAHPPGPGERWKGAAERAVYHRMMALFPPLNRVGLGMPFWDLAGFDSFFYDGPYPMIYSGAMARGRVNPYFVRYVEARRHSDPVFREVAAALRQASS